MDTFASEERVWNPDDLHDFLFYAPKYQLSEMDNTLRPVCTFSFDCERALGIRFDYPRQLIIEHSAVPADDLWMALMPPQEDPDMTHTYRQKVSEPRALPTHIIDASG